jgi:microcystin-dependent protein
LRYTANYKLRKPQRIVGVEDDRADIEDINFNADQLDSVLNAQQSRIAAEEQARANADTLLTQKLSEETARAQNAEAGKLGRTETAANSNQLEGKSAAEFATAEQGAKADSALQQETDPLYIADKPGIALKTEVSAALKTAEGYTDESLTNYLTEQETYDAIEERLEGVLKDKGSVPTRAALPGTADDFDMYLIEDEGDTDADGNPLGLDVYARHVNGALVWRTNDFTVDLSAYETTSGATEKMNAAIDEAKAYADTVANSNPGKDGTAAGFGTPSAAADTLAAGSSATATVTATGANTAKVFSFRFGIPRGADGAKGDKGDKGDAGDAAALPSGVIVMWSGATTAVPSGWALCDGTNGTPNLRDRFIVGAGSTYAVGSTGGSASVTLTTATMPKHNHPISSSSGGVDQAGGFTTTSTGGSGKSTEYTGSGSAHENRPPYYALAFIMKL